MSAVLFHIAHDPSWLRPGPYGPPSLEDHGFVHLSAGHQIEATAARFYADHTELTVLVLDAERLGDVRWEDSTGHGVFPHLYGALPREAVLRVVRWRRGPRGFVAPEVWR